jgi:hypothetical protein
MGLCNAPDANNNGAGVVMVEALCSSLGYDNGLIVRQENGNSCPEVHAVTADGLQWSSDFVSSAGAGLEYLCSN